PIGIIYATAAGTALDRIVGLELGADDYIVKPYELREVLARVRSVLRRVPQPAEPQGAKAETTANRRFMSFGPFHADLDGRFVTGTNGTVIDMAKSEFDVLEVFLTRANRLLTRAAISEAIGFVEDPESSRAVDIRIMRLRKKIEADPANPKFLRTVRGEGYIFSLPTGESN
ncbi:MAG: response regulator transcription factor, partial [Mesorhizobium sp.]